MVHNSFLHCFLLLSTLLPTVTVPFPPHWRTSYPSEKKVEAAFSYTRTETAGIINSGGVT